MSFETLGFLEAVNPALPDGQGRTAAEAFARAAAAEGKGEAAERAEGEAKRAAALDRAEALAVANRALGDPLGEISPAQAAAAGFRDEIADLEAKLAKVGGKLATAQGNVEFHASRMQAAQDSAQRSAGADLLGPAKQALAGHREYVAASRAAWSAAQAGTPQRGRRPFASGVASRSEPVTCAECIAVGASPEEAFLLHADPAPLKAPAVPDGDEQDWLDSREAGAERRGHAYGAGMAVR